MAFGHRFGSEKKIAHRAALALGEGRKDTKFEFPDDAAAPRRRAAAFLPASIGKRPRLAHVWDLAHVPASPAREPRSRALRRSRASPARDRGRRPIGDGAAGALVPRA